LGYDLTEVPPDHSGLTRISERYEVAVFRRFFEAIVEQCFIEKLVWGKELCVDSTDVDANAAIDSLRSRLADEAHLAGSSMRKTRTAAMTPAEILSRSICKSC